MDNDLKLKKIILDDTIGKYFEEIVSKYNSNCLPFDTTIASWSGDTQVLDPNSDAFELSAITGKIRQLSPKIGDQNNWRIAITRNRISIPAYNKLLENPTNVKNYFLLVTTQMIKQQISKLGITPDTVTMGTYLTFKRPDGDGYLRKLECDAGFEYRLYSQCINLELL